MRFHLVVNPHRQDAITAAAETADWLTERGHVVGVERDLADRVSAVPVPPTEIPDCDLVVGFGGDGTLIRASHLCSEKGTPLLGVYFGRFGFVTQCDPHEIRPALTLFLEGLASIEERIMVQSDLMRDGHSVVSLHSLNEAVLQRSTTTRMMTFDLRVSRLQIANYPADGIIVSTPTGSTAYNLSAGGPVVDPSLDALILTAIMPHTLSARPFVLPGDAVVELYTESRGDVVLSADGRERVHMLPGDWVRVARSNRVTRLLVLDNRDFLSKLSTRLFWSRDRLKEDAP